MWALLGWPSAGGSVPAQMYGWSLQVVTAFLCRGGGGSHFLERIAGLRCILPGVRDSVN